MGNCVLRPKAVDDLDSIWDYTVDVWGEEQAERYLRLLNTGFEQIAEDPTRGRPCDDIREGYRRHRVGHHVIFYRPEEEAGLAMWFAYSMSEWISGVICRPASRHAGSRWLRR